MFPLSQEDFDKEFDQLPQWVQAISFRKMKSISKEATGFYQYFSVDRLDKFEVLDNKWYYLTSNGEFRTKPYDFVCTGTRYYYNIKTAEEAYLLIILIL